jgi:hypothetical protein
MSEEMLQGLLRLGHSKDSVEAVRRFMRGEKPEVTSNIAEEISYGYGDGPDANGFWQYQLPSEFNDIVANRFKTVCISDVIVTLKNLESYWCQSKQMPSGKEEEVARSYQVRWNKTKQVEDLIDLPSGWLRTFCPGKNLYVIDYDPRHMLCIKTGENAAYEMALMGAKELIEQQRGWSIKTREGFQLVGAVQTGRHGQLHLLIMAKTFEMKTKRRQRPDMTTFGRSKAAKKVSAKSHKDS